MEDDGVFENTGGTVMEVIKSRDRTQAFVMTEEGVYPTSFEVRASDEDEFSMMYWSVMFLGTEKFTARVQKLKAAYDEIQYGNLRTREIREENVDDNKKPPPCSGSDFIIPGPVVNGVQCAIRHDASHGISMGSIHRMEDGKPIPSDALLVKPRDGSHIMDVVGSLSDKNGLKVESNASGGPAKVTSNEYRNGWDNIFGKKLSHELN